MHFMPLSDCKLTQQHQAFTVGLGVIPSLTPAVPSQCLPPLQVLLLDSDTTRIVSTVYSQSEILEHEVYLVERLDGDQKEQLLHLKVQAAAVSGGSRVH